MNKVAERYLRMLDGSYHWDSVVDSEQRHWWLRVARRYLTDLIRVYV